MTLFGNNEITAKRKGADMNETIDDIDAKILKDLLRDGRKSFEDIAKECKVTKNTIWKHYSKMKSAGIIVGSTIQLNWKKVGYKSVTNVLLDIDPSQMNQLIECIQTIPNVFLTSSTIGKYNLVVTLTLKNLEMLNEITTKIRQCKAISSSKTYVWTEVRTIPENLAIKPIQNTRNKPYEIEPLKTTAVPKARTKIDELDMQLIEKLAKNSRASFRKIAGELEVSTDTVARRYKKLEQNGIIKSIIQINPIKLGYHALFKLDLSFTSQTDTSTIVERLANIPDVVMITRASGDSDIDIYEMARDLKHQFTIQDKITRIHKLKILRITMTKTRKVWPVPKTYISTF